MVGYLKVRRSQWSGPVSYGLGAGGFAAIILLSISSLGALPKPQPQITADNIESHIRTWVDYFGLAIQKQSIPDSYFGLTVMLPSSNQIMVSRPKAHDRYIQFQAQVVVLPNVAAVLAKLSKTQADLVMRQLALDLSRSRYRYTAIGEPLKGVIIFKTVPITNNLNESTFSDLLNEWTTA